MKIKTIKGMFARQMQKEFDKNEIAIEKEFRQDRQGRQ